MKEFRCPRKARAGDNLFRAIAVGLLILAAAGHARAQIASPAMPASQNPAIPSQGVLPFPSMAEKESGDERKLVKPPPGQNMSLQNKKIDDDMERLENQVNERMSQMRVGSNAEKTIGADVPAAGAAPGSGNLSPPDMSGYRDELSEMGEEERQIRLLKLKQERASLAMRLWNTLYDPREFVNGGLPQESEQSKKDKSAEDKKPVAALPPPVLPMPITAPVVEQSEKQALPYPKILEISGTGSRLQATLLVPYLGEMSVVGGTVLPGGRKVEEVSAQGVTVTDPEMGTVPLGYGDSVPLSPATPAARLGPMGMGGQMPQGRFGPPQFQTPQFQPPMPPAMPPQPSTMPVAPQNIPPPSSR